MNRRATAAAHGCATAWKMDKTFDERHACDPVHGDWHVFQPMPRIGHWIVIIMIRINSLGVLGIAFTAKQMEAAVGCDAVHAASRP